MGGSQVQQVTGLGGSTYSNTALCPTGLCPNLLTGPPGVTQTAGFHSRPGSWEGFLEEVERWTPKKADVSMLCHPSVPQTASSSLPTRFAKAAHGWWSYQRDLRQPLCVRTLTARVANRESSRCVPAAPAPAVFLRLRPTARRAQSHPATCRGWEQTWPC